MEYKKDFDTWNIVKKNLDNRQRPIFHEREVWWCHFGVNIGSEQDGEGKESLRPILILKKINERVAYCVPLTSKLKHDYSHVAFYFEYDLNTAILSQTKTIDAKRFLRFMGKISIYLENKIKKALRIYLLT